MKRCEIVNPSPVPIAVTEVPLPQCPEAGAVVRVLYSGICHSDLHVWEGYFTIAKDKILRFADRPDFTYPKVAGHEIVGVVESLGPEASGSKISIGDRVLVYAWGGCGECLRCQQDYCHLCEGSKKEIGFNLPGGYAEYVAVPLLRHLVQLPEQIDGAAGCMIGCAGLTAYSAIKKVMPAISRAAGFGEATKVLVIGAGGVALWGLYLARACFPESTTITCAEVDEAKFAAAKKAGADKTVLFQRDSDTIANVKTITAACNGKVDAILDFVNSSSSAAVAIECLRKGGISVMIGLFGGALELCLPFMPLNSRTITSVYTGSLPDLRELVQLVAKKSIPTPPHTFYPLSGLQGVFEAMKKGQLQGRAIVKFE